MVNSEVLEVFYTADNETVEESVQKVLDKIEELGYIKPIKIFDPL